MVSPLPKEPQWLRANVISKTVEVDRDQQVIRGMIMAQEGVFKSDGRGEFDKDALRSIVSLAKISPNGLKSRFAHPGLSDDGIGKFLGRVKSPRMDEIDSRDSAGQLKTDRISVVRGDLHLDPTSRNTPNGDLGGYIMDLAESDPDALSSSLVLRAEEEFRTDKEGRALTDEEGEELPPLWRPKRLHASDIVDTGDAVDGLLSTRHGLSFDGLPDAVVREATALLDRQFGNASVEVIRARCLSWLDRYLAFRFGEDGTLSEDDGEPRGLARDLHRAALGRAARRRG